MEAEVLPVAESLPIKKKQKGIGGEWQGEMVFYHRSKRNKKSVK